MARPPGQSRGSFGSIAATIIVALIVMRCLVAVSPHLAFGTDPLLDPTVGSEITPLGMLLCDAVLLLACAAGLAWEWRAGRYMDWRVIGLALLPLPVLVWHGAQNFDDLWRGADWFTAVISAATLSQLARDRAIRAAAAAVLLAVIAPLVMRGTSQVFIEHADTVRYFREHRLDVLAAQGIEPGSNAAAIFERRLMQPEATGWFALANVFGSFMVVGVTAMMGLLIAAVSRRLPSGWVGVLVMGLAGAVVGLILCGSKGAYAATGLGLGVLGLLWLGSRTHHRRAGVIGGGLVIASIVAAMAGVIIRGTVLPEHFAGEKSVLFRWHYAVASAAIIAEQPLTGVGPDGYQSAYVRHRLPNAPEEVASAHSVFIDWLASLGVWGIAWAGLATLLVWRAGAAAPSPRMESPTPSEPGDHQTWWILGAGTAAVALAALIEWRQLEGPAIVLRVVGLGAYFGLVMVVRNVLRAAGPDATGPALAAAGAALLAHGQIELTFTQPGAAAWALALLGVAGARGRRGEGAVSAIPVATATPLRLALGLFAPGVLAACAILLAVVGVVPAWRAKAAADQAATLLASVGPAARSDASRHRQARRAASDLLVQAHQRLPGDCRLLLAAAEQRMIAGQLASPADLEDFRQALSLTEQAMAHCRTPRTVSGAAGMARHIATITRDAADWDRAIALSRELTGLDPHGLQPALSLADTLWLAGRRDEARQHYRRVLTIDAAWSLDELKQLTDADRARVIDRSGQEPE